MSMSQMFLPEFDNEIATTRKYMERVPEDKFGWAPHEKSMKLDQLASHLAELLTWAGVTVNTDSFDFEPPGGQAWVPFLAKNRAELIAAFDKNAADARAAIARASDEELMKNWSLMQGGKVLLTMPKVAVLRNFVFNHLVHHRAQLGVYFRINNVPVPATYGPSADENTM